MVNLNGLSNEGDQVKIFDDKNTAENFAESVGTISYEFLQTFSKIEGNFLTSFKKFFFNMINYIFLAR
ncbi:MAG: hypothetical protein CM15mP121_1640 [Bacteroidota bacterium]|nr:MAG: hypothetical protein CM15mP121_1640 [Bacteroidota bacterium]